MTSRYPLTFADIDGLALHFRLTGAGKDRPTIVFANSLGTDFRIWSAVVDDLAADFAILNYDKRGHGLSDVGETPYTIDDHVDDLSGLLDHVGISKAVICGLSVGGLIAQGLYHRRPDVVGGLVLCDTAVKIGDEAMWNARIAATREAGLESIVDSVMERWFTPAFRANGAAFPGYRTMFLRNDPAGYAGTCAALRDADFSKLAGNIAVPVLCMVGEHDEPTPPASVADTARRISGADYLEIADAAHLPCIEQPAAISHAVRKFMARVGEAV